MKYLFLSDIHGDATILKQVLSFFEQNSYDQLCLLGDILNYGPRNGLPKGLAPLEVAEQLNKLSDNIVAIRGNCDSEVDQMLLNFPILSDYALVVDNGKRFFLTHGHVYGEGHLPKLGFDVFMYGHTHLWKLEKDQKGRVICNIGSPTFPKQNRPATFATYENGSLKIRTLSGEVLSELYIE